MYKFLRHVNFEDMYYKFKSFAIEDHQPLKNSKFTDFVFIPI